MAAFEYLLTHIFRLLFLYSAMTGNSMLVLAMGDRVLAGHCLLSDTKRAVYGLCTCTAAQSRNRLFARYPSGKMTSKPTISLSIQIEHILKTARREHLQRYKEANENEILDLNHNLKELVTKSQTIGFKIYDFHNEIHDAYEKRIVREKNARKMV